MKKIYLNLIMLFAFGFINAQTTPLEIILTSDSLNVDKSETFPIEISSSTNVFLGGFIESETYILIKASLNKEIIVIPKVENQSTSNGSSMPNPPGTSIRISKPGGIQQPSLKSSINFYPNPVQNDLTFTSNDLVYEYAIYDLTGLLKLSQKTEPTKSAKINISDLKTANYILVLNLGNGKQLSIQFIKN